jgi:hypothetical protein
MGRSLVSARHFSVLFQLLRFFIMCYDQKRHVRSGVRSMADRADKNQGDVAIIPSMTSSGR